MTARPQDRNLRIIYGVTLAAVLGVASITPAFPRIIRSLQISSQEIGLLITVFTLPGVFLVPVAGILADRWGRKKILVPSLFLFGLAGGLCGLTGSFEILLIWRFLQGVGAAALGTLNITLIGDLYEGPERTAAMGYNASVLSLGVAVYPALGGLLAMFSWHLPFFLPLLAVPLGFLVLYGLDNPEPVRRQRMRQYLLATWSSIKSRQVLGLYLSVLSIFLVLYGACLTYFPLLLSESFAAVPAVIGALMSVMSLSTAAVSVRLGQISRRFSRSTLILGSFLLFAGALLLIPLIPYLWLLALPVIIFGLALGISLPSIQTALAELAPLEQRAAFMSLNGLVLRLGQTLGPLAMGLVFIQGGISGVFLFGGCLLLGILPLLVFLLRRGQV